MTTLNTSDQGFFDGSADPNPGGRLGGGWHIIWADRGRPEITGSAQWPAAPENTNNIGEYRALIGLLSAYQAAEGKGPLIVSGDSQLVIRQMMGAYSVRSPALLPLYREASRLVRTIPGGVSFRWIPREKNVLADTLAGGRRPGAQEPALYAAVAPQGIAPALKHQIDRLNSQGQMSFKEAMNLRVGGFDAYSDLRWSELAQRAGTVCTERIQAAFPGEDAASARLGEAALRWICRGLAAHLAIHKVCVDAEVHAKAETRRRPA